MSDQIPQLYLITPPAFDLATYPDLLARVLDSSDIACLRLALATRDEDTILRSADALREVAHARDIPLVIADHVLMVERLGLDGVHLSDTSKPLRKLRDEMGADAIIGAYAKASRHDGMAAAEAGADYVSFGPVGHTGLGDGTAAPLELFQWWSEMIEVPVVAEGAMTPAIAESLAPITDFLAFGEEVWKAPDPIAALRDLTACLR